MPPKKNLSGLKRTQPLERIDIGDPPSDAPQVSVEALQALVDGNKKSTDPEAPSVEEPKTEKTPEKKEPRAQQREQTPIKRSKKRRVEIPGIDAPARRSFDDRNKRTSIHLRNDLYEITKAIGEEKGHSVSRVIAASLHYTFTQMGYELEDLEPT